MQEENKYSLKKIIIFGIIILILAGLVGFYFINKKNNPNPGNTPGKNLFPFGDGTPSTPVTTGGNVDPSGTPQPNDGTPIATTDGERLRQITIYPVTNFFSFIINRQVLEPKLDEKTSQTKLVATTKPVDMVRWNIKQTGILMDAELSSDAIITTQKTTTQIPHAEELWFEQQGTSATFRTWDPTTRTIQSITGSFPLLTTNLGYCTIPLTQNLGIGSKTSDVKELQKYINRKLSLNIAVDGSLGPKTFALIKNLQTLLNISESGEYDLSTRDAINADCAQILADNQKQKNSPVALSSSVLFDNISQGTVSPDGDQIFYLIPKQARVVGTISTPTGGNARKIFESPATEWSAQWVTKDTIALTTLASREADGYLYFLNTTTGDFKKIIGPVRGLTTLVSPDTKTVLYSESTSNGLVTKLYYPDTGTTKNLGLITLPAKCTWQDTVVVVCGVPKNISGAQYPDAWYQGTLSFSDTVWSINTQSNATTIVLSPNQSFDIIKLVVSPNRNYLYFINKTDQTLWSYRLQ